MLVQRAIPGVNGELECDGKDGQYINARKGWRMEIERWSHWCRGESFHRFGCGNPWPYRKEKKKENLNTFWLPNVACQRVQDMYNGEICDCVMTRDLGGVDSVKFRFTLG